MLLGVGCFYMEYQIIIFYKLLLLLLQVMLCHAPHLETVLRSHTQPVLVANVAVVRAFTQNPSLSLALRYPSSVQVTQVCL